MEGADQDPIRATVIAVLGEMDAKAKAAAATSPVWTLPECVGWIAWRTMDHMPLHPRHGLERLAQDEGERREGKAVGPRLFSDVHHELTEAANGLLARLIEAGVVAFGLTPDGKAGGAIASEQWPLLDIDWTTNQVVWGASSDVAYSEVKLRRSEVVTLWPGEIQSAPNLQPEPEKAATADDAPAEDALNRLAKRALADIYPDGLPAGRGVVKEAERKLNARFKELAAAEDLNINPPGYRKWQYIRNARA